MASQEEARLVARVLCGETRAFDEFVFNYRPFIYAVLTRHMKLMPQDAEEVFQQFLVHVWDSDFRRLREWRGKSSLYAYLGKIARNLARDFRRKEARTELAEPAYRESADPGSAALEHRIVLDSAIAKLSDRDQELIRRRYYVAQS
ncbi:MAG: sigma-70 family RNA polymerase sigma factor, partial [Acidobacteria bacterium]|nr:sigma-70 family RNA polymerase sigma factor [Acidobacteriota bacterium]